MVVRCWATAGRRLSLESVDSESISTPLYVACLVLDVDVEGTGCGEEGDGRYPRLRACMTSAP